MRIAYFAVLCVGVLCAAPLAAHAETDPCKLLTPAQITAITGIPVSAGRHESPGTCAWAPSGDPSKVTLKSVTLDVYTAAAYDLAKQKQALIESTMSIRTIRPAAVGNDAYFTSGSFQTSLHVKQGDISFIVGLRRHHGRRGAVRLKSTPESTLVTLAKAVLATM